MWTRSAVGGVVSLFCATWAALAQPENPVTNGGFEQLTANGWVADWEQVGLKAEVSTEAHTGARALLLHRVAQALEQKRETGLNRAWRIDTGEQDRMLESLKGGLTFWYKALEAPPNGLLRFYIIPMNEEPREGTGSTREWYEVPRAHIGDGEWHIGTVAYDFTDNDRVKWVQVSPRIQGDAPARWLLDDIQWVESTGPVPSVGAMRVRELEDTNGQVCELRTIVKNSGDRAMAATVTLALPEPLSLAEGELTQKLERVGPGISRAVTWRLQGERRDGDVLRVRARAGEMTASGSLTLQTELSEAWLETEQFVLWPGQETSVAFVAFNRGSALLRDVRIRLHAPAAVSVVGPTTGVLDSIPPRVESRLAFRIRAAEQTPLSTIRCTWKTTAGAAGEATAELVIGVPPPEAGTRADAVAAVACDTFEILFPKNAFGYGVGWVYSKPAGALVGVIPSLGRVHLAAAPEEPVPLYAERFDAVPHVAPLGADSRGGTPVGLGFYIRDTRLRPLALPAPRVEVQVSFTSGWGNAAGAAAPSRIITCGVRCSAPPAGGLLSLAGPRFCVGEGGAGRTRDEALFPGLEWLEGDEISSSDLDIDPTHDHFIRHIVHPHMVTIPFMAVRQGRTCAALLWHSRSAWSEGSSRPELAPDRSDVDRPSAVFASPDRFAGHASHTMGLLVPTVPEYLDVNHTVASAGWPAAQVSAKDIRLVFGLYVNPAADSAMAAMRAWFDLYGVVPPRPLPHTETASTVVVADQTVFRGYALPDWAICATRSGAWRSPTRQQWIDEIEWSMNGYLKTLWLEEECAWVSCIGGNKLFQQIGAHAAFLQDCEVAARLTDDEALRAELRERIGRVRARYPRVRLGSEDLGFVFNDPLQAVVREGMNAAALMRSQDEDGGWRFHPHIGQGGVFKGKDYSILGYEAQEAVGLVARRAFVLLRLARMTGEPDALEAGLKALRYMRRFRVPRAAQVWEVPVHTPDILASSDACEAYLEAYHITGEREWLESAVYWQETGLPFLYQWGVDAFPWMRYGSIPVFGATWFRGSWFGRPVQWNGLRWAFAAQKLAELDDTYPWRMLAAGVTVSAMYQQGTDEAAEDFALWPDAISAIDARKARWYFAPQRILKNVEKTLGYEPEPITTVVKVGSDAIRINACGKLERARLQDGTLRFRLVAPEPLPTSVLICGISQPRQVMVNGRVLSPRGIAPMMGEAGWLYESGYRMLTLRPGGAGSFEMAVAGVEWQPCRLVPAVATAVQFEFGSSSDGWQPTHDLGPFSVEDGCLVMAATGSDPYMIRSHCDIDGAQVKGIRVRLAVSAGSGAQFFWTTAESPALAEDKTLGVPIEADGEFHEVVFPVAQHPKWAGQTITSIRLDPMTGAEKAHVKIDFIRGE